MLTASQIDGLRTASEQLLDPVVDFLIEDIARRVAEAGQLTGTAAYQVWRAQNLGMSQKKLKKELQKRLRMSTAELERWLTQAAKTGYNFDISRLPTKGIPFAANSSVQQIVAAAVKQAKKELTNIVRTSGFVGSDGKARELTKAYKKACDDAFMRTVTGAQDYNSAIRDALKGLSDKGIVTIDYNSHRHFTIEAAVRQNIMGGMGIMQEQISQQNHDEMECDGWELSAHANSAPDHEPYQGKQYTDKQYETLNNSLLRRIGTLHCGHAAFPIIIGVHSPQYTDEELEEFRQQNEKGVTVEGRHYTGYEATQRQRELERAIRKKKRHILIDQTVGDEEKLQADQIKLVRLRDEYARFSKAAGLPTQHARAEAAGFTWKDGKAAEKTANIKFKEILEKAKKGGRIELEEDMERIIAGKSFTELQPLCQKLSDRAVRRWYNTQNALIPSLIDQSLNLEGQARQACEMRNNNRTNARDLMRNQKKRKKLDKEDPNRPFDEILADKMKKKGLTRDEAMQDIIGTSSKTRKSVNKKLGLE